MTEAELSSPTPLLAGLSPHAFMRRHWHKKPLLIRQALPKVASPIGRDALFALAAQEGVESRLVRRTEGGGPTAWQMTPGPIATDELPAPRSHGWTLLVQGVDLHVDAAHELLRHFRFIPHARLDDLMVSYASPGGGVGPHVDSYDVFLLQVEGKRRWQFGHATDMLLLDGLPLKVLRNFVAEEESLLEPGDMLYLPPGWAHDGIAIGESIACSIGFRAATVREIAREVLQRTLDAEDDKPPGEIYRDPKQPATSNPGLIPETLHDFAAAATAEFAADREAVACSLGEWLSEPKPNVWFDAGDALGPDEGVRLDRRSRMLWDRSHVFINGESFRASGRDATLMRQLADTRELSAADVAKLGADARSLLNAWAEAGWVRRAVGG